MSRVIYFPIEEIPSRYGEMMNEEIWDQLTSEEEELSKKLLPLTFKSGVINGRNFLDTIETSLYKAKQLALFMEMVRDGQIHKGDAILLHDVFYPGMEAIRYVSDLGDMQWSIGAFNFAGRADPTDLTQELGEWSDSSELGWHKTCDIVFAGSEFHKSQIKKYFRVNSLRVVASGYPYNPEYCRRGVVTTEKKDYCIWPHRPCPEKGLAEFIEIAKRMPDTQFLLSSGGYLNQTLANLLQSHPNIEVREKQSKDQYHANMAAARWFLSTAKQETFGYALHEAAAHGCGIAATSEACNPEFIPEENLFDRKKGSDENAAKIRQIFTQLGPTKLKDSSASGSAARIIRIFREAT